MDQADGLDPTGSEYRFLMYMGGRKFTLSVLIVILVSILVYLGKISDGVYSTIVVATIAAYIAGNVYQRVNAPAVVTPTTPRVD